MRRITIAALLTAAACCPQSTSFPSEPLGKNVVVRVAASSCNRFGARDFARHLDVANRLLEPAGVVLSNGREPVVSDRVPTEWEIGWRRFPELDHAANEVPVALMIAIGDRNRKAVGGIATRDRQGHQLIGISMGDSRPSVLAHEIGHLAGLGHVDNERNVMSPRRWNRSSFDKDQLQKIREWANECR